MCEDFFSEYATKKRNQQHKEKMYLPIFRNCHFPMSPIGGVQKCIKYSQELYKANTPPLSKKKILPTCNFSKYIFSFLWHVCIVEASQILHNFWASSWRDEIILSIDVKSLIRKELQCSIEFSDSNPRNSTLFYITTSDDNL